MEAAIMLDTEHAVTVKIRDFRILSTFLLASMAALLNTIIREEHMRLVITLAIVTVRWEVSPEYIRNPNKDNEIYVYLLFNNYLIPNLS